jgi:hypothetical protein
VRRAPRRVDIIDLDPLAGDPASRLGLLLVPDVRMRLPPLLVEDEQARLEEAGGALRLALIEREGERLDRDGAGRELPIFPLPERDRLPFWERDEPPLTGVIGPERRDDLVRDDAGAGREVRKRALEEAVFGQRVVRYLLLGGGCRLLPGRRIPAAAAEGRREREGVSPRSRDARGPSPLLAEGRREREGVAPRRSGSRAHGPLSPLGAAHRRTSPA